MVPLPAQTLGDYRRCPGRPHLEPEEAILPSVLETMGLHLVMYASDHTHWDSEFPESVRPAEMD
jgi:hypothetical protein